MKQKYFLFYLIIPSDFTMLDCESLCIFKCRTINVIQNRERFSYDSKPFFYPLYCNSNKVTGTDKTILPPLCQHYKLNPVFHPAFVLTISCPFRSCSCQHNVLLYLLLSLGGLLPSTSCRFDSTFLFTFSSFLKNIYVPAVKNSFKIVMFNANTIYAKIFSKHCCALSCQSRCLLL